MGDLSHFTDKHIVQADRTKNTLKTIEKLYDETKYVVWDSKNYSSIANKTERNMVTASYDMQRKSIEVISNNSVPRCASS